MNPGPDCCEQRLHARPTPLVLVRPPPERGREGERGRERERRLLAGAGNASAHSPQRGRCGECVHHLSPALTSKESEREIEVERQRESERSPRARRCVHHLSQAPTLREREREKERERERAPRTPHSAGAGAGASITSRIERRFRPRRSDQTRRESSFQGSWPFFAVGAGAARGKTPNRLRALQDPRGQAGAANTTRAPRTAPKRAFVGPNSFQKRASAVWDERWCVHHLRKETPLLAEDICVEPREICSHPRGSLQIGSPPCLWKQIRA